MKTDIFSVGITDISGGMKRIIKKEYRNILIFRWSIATASIVALFWTIWYLVNGSVPVVLAVPIFLPTPVSRWWDILVGPIFSLISIFLLTLNFEFNLEDNPFTSVYHLLVVGCFVGVLAGVLSVLIYGVICGVVVLSFFLVLSVLSYYFFLLLKVIVKLLILILKWLFLEDFCI